MPNCRIPAVRADAAWKRSTARRIVAIVVALAAMVGPVVGVNPETLNPAEVESKAGVLEVEDLLAPSGAPLDLGATQVVDLGAHGPGSSSVGIPFLEVPEDPPELA